MRSPLSARACRPRMQNHWQPCVPPWQEKGDTIVCPRCSASRTTARKRIRLRGEACPHPMRRTTSSSNRHKVSPSLWWSTTDATICRGGRRVSEVEQIGLSEGGSAAESSTAAVGSQFTVTVERKPMPSGADATIGGLSSSSGAAAVTNDSSSQTRCRDVQPKLAEKYRKQVAAMREGHSVNYFIRHQALPQPVPSRAARQLPQSARVWLQLPHDRTTRTRSASTSTTTSLRRRARPGRHHRLASQASASNSDLAAHSYHPPRVAHRRHRRSRLARCPRRRPPRGRQPPRVQGQQQTRHRSERASGAWGGRIRRYHGRELLGCRCTCTVADGARCPARLAADAGPRG